MKIPKPIPFHEVPSSFTERSFSASSEVVSAPDTDNKLLGTILISFALLAAGGYLYYEFKKNQKRKEERAV